MKHAPHLLLSSSLLLSVHAIADTPSSQEIATHYADLAHAMYQDSLSSAKTLSQEIDELLANPSEETLEAAREAWRHARVPYQQSEVFRFGNAYVDDWEGKVNAWPLDEGLIDYVAQAGSADNPYASANIIANTNPTIAGREIDASEITPALLRDTLHELDGIEANVASGYHAIEFLLWGQDLNGTEPGAGERPASDFSLEDCTHAPCERRRDYLQAATELLISDLQDIVAAWEADGEARQQLLDKGDAALTSIFTGMGSLGYGELAGERINLGLQLHDPEEEHDCFSDNTHYSHWYNAVGIENVYFGRYERLDGSLLEGPSVSALVEAEDARTHELITTRFQQTRTAMQQMLDAAEAGNTFDVLIGEGHAEGNQIVADIVQALVNQTRGIERAVAQLQLAEYSTLDSDALSDFTQ